MNIVIASEYGVEVYKKWSDLSKAHSLEKKDFVPYNMDYIAYLDKESHQISKDIKLIEQVATAKVFPKPKMTMPELLTIANFGILTMLLLGGV